jgi:4'-phosphopantetheinyl transferase EntD
VGQIVIRLPSSDLPLGELVSHELGVPLLFRVARTPAPIGELSPGEAERVALLTTEARKTEWRLGRAALKAALRAIGESDDTTGVELPHARLSLTHSGPVAVAAASTAAGVDGLGVDLEIERTPRPAMARFFLDDSECAWLEAQPEATRASHLVRLWSIKEAVFKADLANASTTLRDYRIADPSAPRGAASRETEADPLVFAYMTACFEGATLAVSVRRRGALS